MTRHDLNKLVSRMTPKEGEDSMDNEVKVLGLRGRLTPLRFRLLHDFVTGANKSELFEAPYGRSPYGNQSPYRCGCEHDCCGHLVGHQLILRVETLFEDEYSIEIEYRASYNF